MTLPSDLPLPTTQPFHPAAPAQTLDGLLTVPGADLVFTQNRAGQYLSFYWKDSQQYGVDPAQLVGQLMNPEGVFVPMFLSEPEGGITPYLEQVCQVLHTQTPIQFEYPFVCSGRFFVFDLVLSPILVPHGNPTLVMVMGQFLFETSRERSLALVKALIDCNFSAAVDRFYEQLAQVVWNVRRSLDLETIWQQTVDNLGEALNATRCLICPYKLNSSTLKVVSEYCQPGTYSMLGEEIATSKVSIAQALTTLKPVTFDAMEAGLDELPLRILAIPTCYKDQPNGLILVYQKSDLIHGWGSVELQLLQGIAEQVGTGIAYATLLEESRNLATELQRVNDSLVRQHRELEDARRQAEAASRLKSEFLANTSHELRTPLNGVIGFLKLIMDGMADDPAEQEQFIQEAYRSAIHLLNIINDILDIAKIEAGKMQLDLNPIKLDDLLTDVESFIRPQAQQKQLSLEIRTPATRDEVILSGNYQRLLQVMLNLLGNAVKFTHEGAITITAEIIPEKVVVQNEEKPGLVKISVADTGIGVSLEKQDKLFQSFSQVDGSRTRQYGGTGLGLAISQKLVEAMGGVVNFYSMGEGLGSTVTFTVPLYQDPVMISVPLTDSSDLIL
jgi:signal transduction histidine kinase